MICLGIKTDQPLAGLYLVHDTGVTAVYEWEAHRMLARQLLETMAEFLRKNNITMESVEGIVLYHGPGSFTGLRIGGSVANALAYGFGIPVVGSSGDDWLLDGARRIASGSNHKIAALEYGGQIHITAQKK